MNRLKNWNIYKMEYYLTIKWNDVLIICYYMDESWRNLMLSEKSHSQKTIYCMIQFTWNVQVRWIHRDRMYCCGYQGLGHGENRDLLNIYFCLLTMPDPLTVWIKINCGKFWKRWEYQTTWPASWETCMQVRKQQLELDVEQQTGSKQEKKYIEAVYCHPAYLTYMQSTSWQMLGWM